MAASSVGNHAVTPAKVVAAIDALQKYAQAPTALTPELQQKFVELGKKLKMTQEELSDVEKYRQLQHTLSNPHYFLAKIQQILLMTPPLPPAVLTSSPNFR